MILVRNSFIAKPGKAGKLASHLKEITALGGLKNPRVMTDLVGDFNTVVMEHEVESLGEFEALIARYGNDPQIREKAGAYLDFWKTGKREIFRIV
ncbi:MAG TPA: hypothetical protein VN519_13900 [Bryobacteraceae bacterium]|nr:hypothetical protein [Bryobacteraceae bacterium]